MSRAALAALVGLATLATGGCLPTRYVPYTSSDAAEAPIDRVVAHETDPTWDGSGVACIVVLAGDGPWGPIDRATIEAILARQLVGRVDRLVGAPERDYLQRTRALELETAEGRSRFARNTGCGYMVLAQPWGEQGVHLLFWAQIRIGLDLSLTRLADGGVLWRARHSAARSDGNVPLSPWSAVLGAVSATALAGDYDAWVSTAEDAVRRMVETMPSSPPAWRIAGGRAAGAR